MNNEIQTLEALLNDVKGNQFLGDARRMSGYLKSISQLADALARKCWQDFELDVIEELREMNGRKVAEGLDVKAKLAKREQELAGLSVKFADVLAQVDSGCFASKEHAARSIHEIAESIESDESSLFPAPMSEEEVKAYCERIGATYSGATTADDLVRELRAAARGSKPTKARRRA